MPLALSFYQSSKVRRLEQGGARVQEISREQFCEGRELSCPKIRFFKPSNRWKITVRRVGVEFVGQDKSLTVYTGGECSSK